MAIDITAMGSMAVLILLTLVFTVLLLLLRKKSLAFHLIAVGLGSLFFSSLLKVTFERARPTEIPRLVEIQGFSYPSGHTFGAAAFYTTLAILACRLYPTIKQRTTIFSLSFFVITLIGISRIYLGAHYPTDVLGGLLVGIAWALIAGVMINLSAARTR